MQPFNAQQLALLKDIGWAANQRRETEQLWVPNAKTLARNYVEYLLYRYTLTKGHL